MTALGVAVCVLGVSLCLASWRASGAAERERESDHGFLLSVLDRCRMDGVEAVARADIARLSAKSALDGRIGESLAASLDAQKDRRAGFDAETVAARELMRAAGADPEDDASVRAWNARNGAGA